MNYTNAKALFIKLWGEVSPTFITITPQFTLTWSGNLC